VTRAIEIAGQVTSRTRGRRGFITGASYTRQMKRLPVNEMEGGLDTSVMEGELTGGLS
jgi:hypothetical protein